MGGGSSRAFIAFFTPPCHGNHPGEINEKKDDIQYRANWIITNTDTTREATNAYAMAQWKLLTKINEIEKWYYHVIPEQIQAIQDALDSQVDIKQGELDNAYSTLSSTIKLNNRLGQNLLDSEETTIEKTVTTQGQLAQTQVTNGKIIDTKNLLENTQFNLFKSAKNQNIILGEQSSADQSNSYTGDAKVKYQVLEMQTMSVMQFGMFIVYFILVFILAYVLYTSAMNTMSKIIILLFFVAYPFYIYDVESFVYFAWSLLRKQWLST
jgi:hypothetical protein